MVNNQPKTPILVQDLGLIYATDNSKRKYSHGIYQCECGKYFRSQHGNIKSGNVKSCGCYSLRIAKESNTIHGFSYHPLYATWKNMVDRCNKKNLKSFVNYGGRGIKICDRWLKIENFIEDMYSTYQDDLTLDRIDVNGNYEPSNCRWATKSQQMQNTQKIRKNNKTGYRGVSIGKYERFVAQIIVFSKHIYLGKFKTAIEAAYVYDKYIIDNNLEHTNNGLYKKEDR